MTALSESYKINAAPWKRLMMQGSRAQQGSVLCLARPQSAAACACMFPTGSIHEVTGTSYGCRARYDRGYQSGEPGDMLCRTKRLSRLHQSLRSHDYGGTRGSWHEHRHWCSRSNERKAIDYFA